MIIFDASYLVVMLQAQSPPAKDRDNKPVERVQDRINYLVGTLDVASTIIGVPTPALAEVLVRAGGSREKYLKELRDTARFEIVPFGVRAAVEAGELIAKLKSENKSQPLETWAKIKFDVQIACVAKAESATAIYSDDKNLENHGKRLRIPVVKICDLPLPPPPESEAKKDFTPTGQGLLSLNVEGQDPPEPHVDLTKELSNEEKNGPQTDAPKATAEDSPAVQGSDSGRAQGEAAKEKPRPTKTKT